MTETNIIKMNNLKIISGGSNLPLAQNIAKYLDVKLVDVTLDKFGDGETFVQINENIRGSDVYIIQSTSNPANDNLMELLILIDAAKRASAGSVTAVIPFFGYARQDRKDRPRVPITAKLVANMLTTAGADRIITMDLHAPQIQGFFDIPVDNLFAAPLFANELKSDMATDTIIISPDAGGIKRAEAMAKALKTKFGFVAKTRVSDEEVEATSIVGKIKGQKVILLDDMTESLGTLMEAAKLCKKNGAASVIGVVSHCILNGKGLKRLRKQIWEAPDDEQYIDTILTTNTVIQNTSFVRALDVSILFGEAIKRTHTGESVTSLFEIK